MTPGPFINFIIFFSRDEGDLRGGRPQVVIGFLLFLFLFFS